MVQRAKVVAYITHESRLLVFSHADEPAAGIQVPAGTVEPDEPPDVAVRREAWEETGLADLEVVRLLGTRIWHPPHSDGPVQRTFYHLRLAATAGEPPVAWEH